jgi:hypothetical protein
MLNIGRRLTHDCQGPTRRALLQLGACSALGLTLPDWLKSQAAGKTSAAQVKSVLLLWLWGGPSHHETWDPKPNAPSQVRGAFRPIATATPGFQVCELLPELARRSGRYAILRGMNHNQPDHNVGGTIGLTGHVAGAKASGGVPFPGKVRPSMGSLISYLTRGRRGHWPVTCIGPICKVSGEQLRGQTAGTLGAAHDPFRLEGFTFEDGVRVPELLTRPTHLTAEQFDGRRSLLRSVDALQKRVETSGEVERLDELRQKAFALVTAPATKGALNLDAEKDALRDRYGRTIFGQNLILGRRLIETGVPFVQVNWSGDAEDEQQGGDGGWDLHYRLFERMHERYCPIYDRALSALLDDLNDRSLLDTTLVVAMGEFGRSPKISAAAGREHWPWVYSVFVAGGGVPGGLVLGSSTADGGHPRTYPVHPANLLATIIEKMGLDRFALGDRDASIVEPPIRELL